MSTYTPIASISVTSATASVTFAGIPQTFTDLVLVVSAKHVNTGSGRLDMTFNGDTAGNYSVTRMWSNTTTTTSDKFANQAALDIGFLSGTGGSGNGVSVVNFQNYSNATTYKSILCKWNSEPHETASSRYILAEVGQWRNTAAVTSIQLGFAGINIAAGLSLIHI